MYVALTEQPERGKYNFGILYFEEMVLRIQKIGTESFGRGLQSTEKGRYMRQSA